MDEKDNARVIVDGTLELRRGVYSNIAKARTTSKETIVDFAMIDSTDDDGTLSGVLQARIIMSNEAFAEFAEMITEHFKKSFEKVEEDE